MALGRPTEMAGTLRNNYSGSGTPLADTTGVIGTIASLITAAGALPVAALAQARKENRLYVSLTQSCKSLEDVGEEPRSRGTFGT